MSVKLERALRISASKLGLRQGTERFKRYVYGTLNKIKRGKNGR